MAKLQGPALSLGATGQFAKTIVFSTWKGIKYGKQYVVPANPNTADQQTQRGILTAVVAFWHNATTPINALLKAAMDREARYFYNTMSGFNKFVKNWIDTVVASASLVKFYGTDQGAITGSGAVITASTAVSTVSVKLRYGTSPTAMINTDTRDEGGTPGTIHTFTLTGLSGTTVYYYQPYSLITDSAESAGIGTFTTT